MIAYKALTKDLKSPQLKFQYELNKIYTVDSPIKICVNGFHACRNPFDVFSCCEIKDMEVYRVELGGTIKEEGNKVVASCIRILYKIPLKLLYEEARKYIKSLKLKILYFSEKEFNITKPEELSLIFDSKNLRQHRINVNTDKSIIKASGINGIIQLSTFYNENKLLFRGNEGSIYNQGKWGCTLFNGMYNSATIGKWGTIVGSGYGNNYKALDSNVNIFSYDAHASIIADNKDGQVISFGSYSNIVLNRYSAAFVYGQHSSIIAMGNCHIYLYEKDCEVITTKSLFCIIWAKVKFKLNNKEMDSGVYQYEYNNLRKLSDFESN